MDSYTERELGYSMGMVDRRLRVASTIGQSMTVKQAMSTHREICGAVKEVRRHHQNIVSRVGDQPSEHARDSARMLSVVEEWLDKSRASLSKWQVTEAEMRSIEEGVGL